MVRNFGSTSRQLVLSTMAKHECAGFLLVCLCTLHPQNIIECRSYLFHLLLNYMGSSSFFSATTTIKNLLLFTGMTAGSKLVREPCKWLQGKDEMRATCRRWVRSFVICDYSLSKPFTCSRSIQLWEHQAGYKYYTFLRPERSFARIIQPRKISLFAANLILLAKTLPTIR